MPVHGKVGTTFTHDSITKKYGKANVTAGALGEKYLSDLLTKTFPHLHIWASLRSPDPKYHSDIDLAIASGNTVLLIDAKHYAAGHVYWTFTGKMMRDLSPMKSQINGVETWKPISRNMAMCVDKVQQKLPDHRVIGMVVCTPTRKANGLPLNVTFLRWPGGIKTYLPEGCVRKVRHYVGNQEVPSQKAGFYLNTLLP